MLRVSPDPLETVDLLETHQVDIATPQPTEDVVSALVGVDDVTVTAGSEGTFEHLDLSSPTPQPGSSTTSGSGRRSCSSSRASRSSTT